MKILIVTRSEWSNENSTGNTITNLFQETDPKSLANIYFRTKKPNNNICKTYFTISEINLIKRKNQSFTTHQLSEINPSNKKIFFFKITTALNNFFFSKLRSSESFIPLVLQDILWRFGWWKSKELNLFLNKFKPDIIFSPSFHTPYTHRVVNYIAQQTGAKIVSFHADDYISSKINTKNPFKKYFIKTRQENIIKTINSSSMNYCISKTQAEAYSSRFNLEFKVLYKGATISSSETNATTEKINNTIKFVYAGSLLYGRWKTLIKLMKEIEDVNKKNLKKVELDIYSQYNPPHDLMIKIKNFNASKYHGAISNKEVDNVLKNADAVLHLESFDTDDIFITKYSFSTKIVDCLASGSCLFAIGPKGIASIDYLEENSIALVANSEEKIHECLNTILNNRSKINDYMRNARHFIEKNHNIVEIRKSLMNDLKSIMDH